MLKEKISSLIVGGLDLEEVVISSSSKFSDLTINPSDLNLISSKLNLTNDEITQKIRSILPESLVSEVKVEAGFLNLRYSDNAVFEEANSIISDLDSFLKTESSEKILIDYSGPNIAKPFSVGHLRSTVIGQANYNIHKAIGYDVVGINHIGDWGTQFGKLIYAIKTWGDEERISVSPIEELNSLYVKFHEEAEKNPVLNDDARAWSKRLEDGDEEARRLWQKCVDWSFKEFDRIYKIMEIKIDNVVGESFYEDKLAGVISELKEKELLVESEGAMVVLLEELPPALIMRQDGATLYMTRDLAALKYRIEKYHPSEIIYHVGQDQNLHFRQLEAVASKLGWLDQTKIIFAGHGLMRLPEGKMSTRLGRVVLLDDLIKEAKERVRQMMIEMKAEDFEDKVADLAVSAIKYADLSVNRQSDVVFSFERMIDLKGNSAIYLQYVYARICSLINDYEKKSTGQLDTQEFSQGSIEILKLGLDFKDILQKASDRSQPNVLADYAFEFCVKFNSFYEKNRILTNDNNEARNIHSVYFAKTILASSLELLGLSKFERL